MLPVLKSAPSAECYFAVVKIAKADDTFTLVQGPTAVPEKVNKAIYGAKILPVADHGFIIHNAEQAGAGLARTSYHKYNSGTDEYDPITQLNFSSYFADLQAIYMAGCRAEYQDDIQGHYILGRVNAAYGQAGWMPIYGYETQCAYLDSFL